MNWKSTVLVSGAGLVATWMGLVSAPTVPGAVVPQPAPVVPRTAAAASDIEQQAARLQTRLHGSGDFRPPSRNPFRFAARLSRRPVTIAPAPAIDQAPPVVATPPRPTIRLRGIATDIVNGAPQYTAIVTTDAGLLLVREGDAAGAYRVTRIEEEAIELSGADGALRLTLAGSKSQ